jgi:hypothetical protein
VIAEPGFLKLCEELEDLLVEIEFVTLCFEASSTLKLTQLQEKRCQGRF